MSAGERFRFVASWPDEASFPRCDWELCDAWTRGRIMGRLTLTLLGGFQARLDSGPALRLRTRHAQALLAYLAMPRPRAHARDALAVLLWGHLTQGEARSRLRQTLFTLRRTLAGVGPPCLQVDGDTVVLDPGGID